MSDKIIPVREYLQSTHIDKASRVPLYAQLFDIFVHMIDNGILSDHQKLPGEEELCVIYDVSRTVVRQALQELKTDGYLYKQRGKGAFVQSVKTQENFARFYSFTHQTKHMGKMPLTKVLEFKRITIPAHVKHVFAHNETHAYFVRRLHMADGEIIIYTISHFPCSRLPDLQPEYFEGCSLYDMMMHRYTIRVLKMEEELRVVDFSSDIKKHLKEESNHVGIEKIRTTYDAKGVVEYTNGFYTQDNFVYKVVFHN